MKQTNQPPVLAAMNERQEYHKPTLEVIDICIESKLLTGSNPTSINPIKRNPVNE